MIGYAFDLEAASDVLVDDYHSSMRRAAPRAQQDSPKITFGPSTEAVDEYYWMHCLMDVGTAFPEALGVGPNHSGLRALPGE